MRLTPEQQMPPIYHTLKNWSDDADLVYANWDNLAQGQKDNAVRELIERVGQLCNGLAVFLRRVDLD